jgi:hypothetical protein
MDENERNVRHGNKGKNKSSTPHPSRAGKQSGDAPAAVNQQKKAKDVPLLRGGKDPNLYEWERAAAPRLKEEYENQDVFGAKSEQKAYKYVQPPVELSADQFSAVDDPTGTRKARYIEQAKIAEQTNQCIDQMKPKMFAAMISLVSDQSYQLIKDRVVQVLDHTAKVVHVKELRDKPRPIHHLMVADFFPPSDKEEETDEEGDTNNNEETERKKKPRGGNKKQTHVEEIQVEVSKTVPPPSHPPTSYSSSRMFLLQLWSTELSGRKWSLIPRFIPSKILIFSS